MTNTFHNQPSPNKENILFLKPFGDTGDGFLLVLNAAEIPLGIIDRNNIGYFILKKIGLNLPNEILAKFKTKNDYPLGLQLPRIINLMRKRGDIE